MSSFKKKFTDFLFEKESEVENSMPVTQVNSVPNANVQVAITTQPQSVMRTAITTVDEGIYNKLSEIGDTVEGYSFMEFFLANKQTADLSGAISTLQSMSGLTKETLLLQGNESVNAVSTEFDKQISIANSKKESVITQSSTKRQKLMDSIEKKEAEIAEMHNELAKIDVNKEVSSIQERVSVLTYTKDAILSDIQNFLSKIK